MKSREVTNTPTFMLGKVLRETTFTVFSFHHLQCIFFTGKMSRARRQRGKRESATRPIVSKMRLTDVNPHSCSHHSCPWVASA